MKDVIIEFEDDKKEHSNYVNSLLIIIKNIGGAFLKFVCEANFSSYATSK